MLIGLTGRAGSGKDTVARIIQELIPGTERYAFADPLKRMALAIDPIIEQNGTTIVRLSNLVDNPNGWDSAKKHPEVRRFLQRLGTEGVRETFGEDAWVVLFEEWWDGISEPPMHAVVTDVRFPNEATTIRVCGGTIVRVVRDDVANLGENSKHASEQPITPSVLLYNDGDLDTLRAKTETMLRGLKYL